MDDFDRAFARAAAAGSADIPVLAKVLRWVDEAGRSRAHIPGRLSEEGGV